MDDPTEFLLRLQEKMDKSLQLAQSTWHKAQAAEKRTQALHETMREMLAEATKPPPIAEPPPVPPPSVPPPQGAWRVVWRPCWGWMGLGAMVGAVLGGSGVALRLWAGTPLAASDVLKILFGA